MTMVAEPKKAAKKKPAATAEAESVDQVPAPGEPGFDWDAEYPGEQVFVKDVSNGLSVGFAGISEKRQPSFGFMRESRKKPQFDQIMDMVEFVTNDKALAILDGLTGDEVVEVFLEWSEWSKALQGE